jgi:hypothetical protein
MSLLSKIKSARIDLQARQQEEYERKDPSPFQSGSVIVPEKLPKGVEIWRPGIGEHEFDIIPWIATDEHPYEDADKYCWCLVLQIYREVGIMRDHFVAPYTMYKQPDPIAEYITKTDLEKAEFNRRRAKKRCFYLVWVHDTPEEEQKGIQVWEVAHWFIYDQLKELSIIPKEGGHISYMKHTKEEGRRIWLKIWSDGQFEGADGQKVDNIRYTAPKFIERKADIPDSILEQSFPLETCIHLRPTYGEIYRSFYGADYVEKKEAAPATRTTLSETTQPGEPDDIPKSVEGYTDCPSGHVFGKDIDAFPADCNNCPAWDDCSDEKDRLAESPEVEKEPEKEPKEEPKEEKKTTTGRSKLRGRLGKRNK